MKPIKTKSAGRYATLGGTGVIFGTAWVAVVEFSAMRGFTMEPIDWILLVLMSALVIGGGIAMARFVRTHGDDIGEARFDTTHRDDPKEGKRP